MARPVKQSGTRSINNRRQTMHGGKAAKRLNQLGGKAMGRDKKPSGFLSRKTKP